MDEALLLLVILIDGWWEIGRLVLGKFAVLIAMNSVVSSKEETLFVLGIGISDSVTVCLAACQIVLEVGF